MTSTSPMVCIPLPRLIGCIQKGGHGRDVFAKAGLTVFLLSGLRLISVGLPLCITVILAKVGVIPTGLFSLAEAVEKLRDITPTTNNEHIAFKVFICDCPPRDLNLLFHQYYLARDLKHIWLLG